MSDNEAREETPPEYQPEDIGEDWDIYLQLKGVLLEPNCNDDETYYNKQNFTKLLQLEKGLIRNAPVLRLVGDQSISTISYQEYRILNKNMKEAHPFPYVVGNQHRTSSPQHLLLVLTRLMLQLQQQPS